MHGLLAAMIAVMTVACGPSHETADASGPSRRDASNPVGAFGDPCTSHGDCTSGYCVEAIGGVGGVCTRTCDGDCPPDWDCRDVQLGETPVKLCIPNAPQLCLACATDSECGSDAACLLLDGIGSCATKCTTSCPTGYQCAADATGAHSGTYCQPIIGSCTCSAAMEGASRACTTTNAIGTCYGTETCAATTGWSSCSATSATLENCDGNDNDCDFLIDEDVGGGETCTNTVAGVGSCPGTRTCVGAAGFVCQGQMPTLEVCNYADDDCDSKADESFTTLGTLCSPGIGACQRFGSMRCNTAGDGVECSVTAGAPGVELCNQLDDDCDNKTDETFTTLGSSCSVGLGVCTRYGTTTCSGDGLTTTCSATPGTSTSPETCNYLDDNCDGTVDNGFRNPVSGAYDTTANCGACGNDCNTVFTGANSSGVCSTGSGAPQCVMVCNAGTFDLNNSTLDGCEFVLDATSVYVSVSEAGAADDTTCGLGPTGTGAGNHPCRSIAMGLARAAALARPNLRIADGTYDQPVAMVTGRHLFGGYRAGTWERHLATTSTVIQGVTSTGNNDATVTASNVTSATLEGFVVRGSFNTKSSGNSYAIYISGGNSTLAIRNNQIFAGRGGPGAAGTPGTNGTAGANGGGSVAGSYDSFTAMGNGQCNASNNRQLTNGGVRSCGGNNVNGGNGGGNRCTPMFDVRFSGINGFSGNPGAGAGGGAAGAGAQAGRDGELESGTCYVPTQSWLGADGNPGQPGGHGSAVSGCTASGGSIVAGHWVNGAALAGTVGSNGGGAGGGGGGGGADCTFDCGNKDRLGAHGGGGGSGGCAGSGGGGGSPGGGVFGIFIVGGSAPTITNNTIQRGAGGTAGDGGIGGAGGLGGSGGIGGAGAQLCTGKGGRGGDGGAGGHGSGGGGGCGGSSFAIYTSGIGTPTYCMSNAVTGGSPGQGGAGGYSGGNAGGNGTNGVLQGCTSI